MNAITLSGPVADALGWTLVHAVWQGFALVLPAAILLHVLRNRSSALRYRMGVTGLLSQVLTSVVTFSWLYKPAAAVSAVTMTGQAPQTLLVNWQTLPQTLSWPVQVQQFLAAHLSEFVLLYIIGVAVFVLRLAGGWLYLQRLSRTATIPASDRLDALVQSLRTVMQLGPVARVRESARVAVPMVVGSLKPILLLPIGLVTNLSMAELEAVLAHELAHVKRHDYAVNLLQSVVEVLYFFHPALWWLSARVREEREHCCDDLAVQTIGGNGRILAQALAHVEEFRLSQLTLTQLATPALAMALTSKRQLLLHRVRRVLGVPTRPFVSNGSLAGLTLATLLLLSVSVYAVQQQPQPKPTAKTTQPKSTRRHKVDGNTEFGISDNKKLDYVIWKGQKLPASRVAKLQKLYDQVMAGQLNRDDVKQPDRDILLQIIEGNHSFDKGMTALYEGLAQIDYSNIVASTLTNIPLSPDGTVEGLARVNYDSMIRDAFARIDTNIVMDGTVVSMKDEAERDRQQAFHQQKMDSLSQLIAQRSQQMQDSLPDAEMQVALANLQVAKTRLHEERNTMAQGWETRVKKLREPFRKMQGLKAELYELEKQATYTQKLANNPSFSSVKSALAEKSVAISQKQTELKLQIDSIEKNEIRPNLDYTHFKRMARNMDSIRAYEEEIIRMSEEMGVEPIDHPRVAPRPPKPPLPRLAPIKPVAPAPAVKPVPAPRPAPAPKPAPTPTPAPAPAPAPKP